MEYEHSVILFDLASFHQQIVGFSPAFDDLGPCEEKMSKPDNTYVKDWLEVSAEDDGSPSHHDSLILHEAGLATSLYQACSQQLSRLAAVWPASSQSTQDRLRRARLARLRSKVILFGDSFDQGKLEACLNGHDILHTNVIALLYDIGNVLQRG